MTQQDVIKAFMASLDTTNYSGTTALNEAISAATATATGKKFTTVQQVINSMKTDIAAAGSADKFLKDYCGIDLDNDDTGAITGSDAGGSTTKTAKSVVPESTAFQSYDYNSIYLSDYGLSIYLSEISDTGYVTHKYYSGYENIKSYELPSRNLNTLSDKEKYVWSAYCNWWAKEGIKLIQESYGTNFGFTTSDLATPRILYFGFYYSNNGSTADSGPISYYNDPYEKLTSELEMRVNMTTFSTIDTSDPNGSNISGDYLDRTIAHEFTHCLMAANINYYTKLPQFIREGMAELTIGGDVGASNKSWLKMLADSSAVTGSNSLLDQVLDLNNTSTGDAKAYAGGYMFLRYLAKQAADPVSGGLNLSNNTANTVLNGGSENDTITNNSGASNVQIYGGNGDDRIENFASKVMVMGGANNDSIYNYYNSNTTIYGGDGKDYIVNNGGSNVTLSGGNDDDSFSVDGVGVSINGDAGNDSIKIFTYSTEKITVKGGTGNDTIDNANANGVLYQYASGDDNDVILGATAKDTIKITGSTYKKTTSGSDLILSVGSGAVTVKGAANVALTIDGTLENTVPSNVVSLTSGNDTYSNSVSGATIYALGGNDFITNERTATNTLIDASAGGNNTIRSIGNSSKIITGSGKDSIVHGGGFSGVWYGNNSTIDSGAGDDTIQIWAGGDSVYANAGAGNDTVLIYGSRSTIDAGAGNDSITSSGNSYVSIFGGAGADKITVSGNGSTVNGGAGDDSITNTNSSSVGNVYVYSSDDGNDTLSGATANDTLKILDGTYSLSGSIVSVYSGENLTGTIRLDNSASVKIDGTIKTPSNIIYNYNKNSVVSGTSSNETINNYAGGAKIYGNGGDDYLYTSTGPSYTINSAFGYVTLDGGAGNDTIMNFDPNVSINGGAGNDYVSLGGNYKYITVNGGAGNDTIKNNGTLGSVFVYNTGDGNDVILGATAKDTIKITGSKYKKTTSGSDLILSVGSGAVTLVGAANVSLTIDGTLEPDTQSNVVSLTAGNDNYSNSVSGVIIYAGAGNDSVKNSATNVTISGGAGSDTVLNQFSAYTTVQGSINSGDGNDRIINILGWYTTLDGGAGNDTIQNYAGSNYVTILGGADADSISNGGSNIKIDGGDGADYIYNYNEGGNNHDITVSGGAGNDTIQSGGYKVLVDGGAGNDKITLLGSNFTGITTVTGGAGNDSIENKSTLGSIFVYSTGDGFDTIVGVNSNDTLFVSSGSISSSKLSGSDAVISISGGSVTLKDYANKKFWLKVGTAAAKQVSVTSEPTPALSGWQKSGVIMKATLASASDLDLNENYASGATKIDGSKLTTGRKLTGNSAANSIKGGSGADTIYGGAGNDTVSLGGGADVYVYSSGNDLIQDYNPSYDKIKLASASVTGASLSSSNVILTTSEGNITVKSGKGKNITIIDASGNETTKIYPIETLPSGWQKSGVVMKATLAGASDLDLNENYASGATKIDGSKLTTDRRIIGNSAANSIKGGSGADTIYGGAGNDTVSLGGGADIYVYSSGNDLIQDYNPSYDKIQLVSASITGTSTVSANLVLQTTAGNITVKNGKGKNITVIDDSGNRTIYPTVKVETLPSGWQKSGVVMKATLAGASDLDLNENYASGTTKIDGSKLTTGRKLTGNSAANSIKGGSGADTIDGGTGNDTLYGGAGNDLIHGTGGTNKIYGDAGDDVLYGGTSADTLSGGAGNDTLYGDSGNDSLSGGAGNDVLIGGGGNDTLTGGAGNDIFNYSLGDDLITDYAAGQDKIQLSYATIQSASVSGSNVVFKTSAGNLTVRNGKGKNITVIDSSGVETTKIYPDTVPPVNDDITYNAAKTASTLNSGFSGSYTAESTIVSITSNASSSVKIVGNAKANIINAGNTGITISGGSGADTIRGGSGNDSIKGDAGNDYISGSYGNDTIDGGAGNDILYGVGGNNIILGGAGADTIYTGTGNDTLTGGAGNDVFVCFNNSGNSDVITDYAAGDKIQLSYATIRGTSYSGNDVVFSFQDSTLTVKNGKGKSIAITDTSGKTTTKTYTSGVVYGSSALMVDDNFIGGGTTLDEICAENYSVTQIETSSNFETIAQSNFLTLTTSN